MTKPESSEYLRNQAWVLLHYVHDLIVKSEEYTFMQEAGISYQHFMVLMAMKSVGGPVKEAILSRLLKREPNSVSMITDRMEKLGLVKKTRSLTDRRLVEVAMTPAGDKKFKQGFKIGNSLVQRLVTDFSDDELNQLVKLLDNVAVHAAGELRLNDQPAEFAEENIQNLVKAIKK